MDVHTHARYSHVLQKCNYTTPDIQFLHSLSDLPGIEHKTEDFHNAKVLKRNQFIKQRSLSSNLCKHNKNKAYRPIGRLLDIEMQYNSNIFT